MREARSSSRADRKAIYETGGVANQQEWYQRKENWNKRGASRWTGAILAVEVVGIICGILKTVGSIEGDLLTFSGVIIATMTAWLQAKQHRMIATAYTVTALELASVRSKIADQNSEVQWAKFVNDAE